ncbi:sigma-70 family RNA polymerase sigma factor [Frigoriglobus tundricola]|uniref:ECF RNA polymerase sigma factor SigE n=1 Tax=Frigoriglobus tundricola TaxID=2774151 RepID=A0A6M5YSU9_9BACT|nr:sigma-70 family RNA polymerase sigma factor [Frigoriglobus tundricola]QJW97135.1 hypothetical protein FTUN_4700 [Frigoriglobus tundricola]
MRLTAALQLVRTATLAPVCDTSDAELLRRFCRDRDETAFREILRRYEALVRGASRRLTRDHDAVDDAVQATFLALARKAHEIRHAEALPSWLYRVARSVTARTPGIVTVVAEPVAPAPSPLDQLSAREALAIFDEELDRLPPAHRSAVLLCTVEGSTVEDAARRLGTTPGAVRGWLQRGRDRLRQRLSARGVELAVALSLLVVGSATRAAGPAREAIVQSVMAAHRPVTALTRLASASYAVWVSLGALTAGTVSALVLLSPGAGNPQPVPPPKVEAKADELVTRDNLPEGAVARIGSPRLRHAGDVTAMAFSNDGRWLATASPASGDKSVRVWDLADGKQRHRIPIAVNPHESSARHRAVAVAFAADGKRLLILDAHGFRSFDAAAGQRELEKVLFTELDPNQFFPAEGIIGTGFSPDTKMFAVVRRNGEMLLGDTATGAVKRTIAKSMNVPENTYYTHADVLFTPSGSEACVPIPADSVPIFDTATGESKRSLPKELVPQYGATNNAAFTADGRQFLSAVTTAQKGRAATHAISVGDVATGKVTRAIPAPTPPRALALSPNGKLLAVAGDSNTGGSAIRVLDLESGKELQSVPLGLTPALLTFSPDSRFLAGTCHYEGRVTVWDIGKNALHPQSADESTWAARFDRLGNVELNRFVFDRKVTVDWRNGKVLEDRKLEPRGRWFEARSADGKVRAELDVSNDKPRLPLAILVKDAATGRAVARLDGLPDYPRGMVFADQNRLLVTVTQDDVLSVWDVAAGKLLWSEKYPARSFGYMGMGQPEFDAANRRMAIGSKTEAGTVIDIWEFRTPTRVARWEVPHVLLTDGIAFSPDGEVVAGGSETVTCWRVPDGHVIHTLSGHVAKESPNDRLAIRCAFSADGRKLLTVDGSGTIRVWEFATGQLIRTFTGHHGQTNAAFSPDARAIVGASSDAPVLVWDVYGLAAPPPFDADRVWTDLADPSAATGFRAVRELCAAPREAITFLKGKLKPETIDPKTIDGWVKDLSAEEFAVRERATAELAKQGETIAPLLRNALGTTTDAEGRHRLTALLRKTERLSPADLRVRRALDALEHLGTPEAHEHLNALARGTAGCLRTVQAAEALSRISGQK